MNRKNEVPLVHFRGRNNRSSQAIGYGKALMVFHMLKKLLGEKTFFDSLRRFIGEHRFQPATWKDLQGAFERSWGRDLEWFFRQWVSEKGLAEFELGEVKVKPQDGKFEVEFEVRQKGRVYSFELPVSFCLDAIALINCLTVSASPHRMNKSLQEKHLKRLKINS